jgi:hypothetical protein
LVADAPNISENMSKMLALASAVANVSSRR